MLEQDRHSTWGLGLHAYISLSFQFHRLLAQVSAALTALLAVVDVLLLSVLARVGAGRGGVDIPHDVDMCGSVLSRRRSVPLTLPTLPSLLYIPYFFAFFALANSLLFLWLTPRTRTSD